MKEFLSQKGIAYKEFDMKQNDFLRDIIEAKYGIRQAPVIEVGDGRKFEVVIGADFAKINQLLEKYVGTRGCANASNSFCKHQQSS